MRWLWFGALLWVALPAAASPYRDAALACLDNLLEHGRDRYGEVHTPMFMSVIDTRTNEAPWEPETLDALIRTEDRMHRRNPGGCDLWDDQPLLRALYAATEETGEAKYADAADDYIRAYFERAKKENGLLAWGSHIYYDAYKDAPAGDGDGNGPHETLVLVPLWDEMYRVAPEAVADQIRAMWRWHVADKSTGLFNRHDDLRPGCDFAFFGGELAYAFAFLAEAEGDPQYADRARMMAARHWEARNPETNLAPDAPSTGERYDAKHCFTTVPGPYAQLLLRAWQAGGDTTFRDQALAHIHAYHRFGWDENAQRFRGMLALDGAPVMDQPKGDGYDRWKPTGYVDTWRATMFSYEFPLAAAQAAIEAHRLTGDAESLEAAQRWATHIRTDLPVHVGRRWKEELHQAVPEWAQTGGGYAECYARAIDFFVALHAVTGEAADLDTARSIADDAIAKLRRDNGWITGHPATPYYESVYGVPMLIHALLALDAQVEAANGPAIRKLGTIDVHLVETTPVVFQDKVYRFEYVRERYEANTTGDSYFRFIDHATGEATPAFARGYHLGSAMVDVDRVVVTGTNIWDGERIDVFVSEDLQTWESWNALELPGYGLFNTSMSKRGEEYVLMFEVGRPPEIAGARFTARFATSPDLKTWTLTPPECTYTKERYSAPHCLRYVDGWFYNFYLHANAGAYEQRVVRSRDLVKWEESPVNPVLRHSEADRQIANRELTEAQREHIRTAENRNNSDFDYCEFEGQLIINYSWGDQRGNEFLAEARYDGSERAFLSALFPD